MTLIIEITSETEQQLRAAAQGVGLSPDVYVLQLIRKSLSSQTYTNEQESTGESDLIQTVHRSMSDIDWTRYRLLVKKRQAETLTAREYDELLQLTNQVEAANVERLKALVKLAELKDKSIGDVMDELALKKIEYL